MLHITCSRHLQAVRCEQRHSLSCQTCAAPETAPLPPGTMRSCGCRSIEEERADAKYTISVSIVEIYNEMVHDLLADQGKADPELQKGPTGFTIPDLTQTGAQKTRVHLSSHSVVVVKACVVFKLPALAKFGLQNLM